MSSLVPLHVNPAALPALAVLMPVEAAISARFEGERNRAGAPRGAAERDGGQVRNAMPPHQAVGEARGYGDVRPQPHKLQAGGRDDRDGWPSAAFYAQHLSQEAFPDDAPTLGHAAAAAKYPSLGYDIEIFLPGQPILAPAGNMPRIDITV